MKNIFIRKSPLIITGDICRLELAEDKHAQGVLEAALKAPFLGFVHIPRNFDEAVAYVKGVQDRLQFVIIRLSDETIVGCTRLEYGIEQVELGWTWLQEDARGTGINLESKILLFRYIFEVTKSKAVYITVPTRNIPSLNAMKKLTLVHVTEGFSTVFCLTKGEWEFRKDQIIEASKAKGIHPDPDII